jgi:hypothetical protein
MTKCPRCKERLYKVYSHDERVSLTHAKIKEIIGYKLCWNCNLLCKITNKEVA